MKNPNNKEADNIFVSLLMDYCATVPAMLQEHRTGTYWVGFT